MESIGSRIRKRREELGVSQDELARRVGYKSRTSIAKIESDGRELPQSKIYAIATALTTTPSYIMGWEEEKEDSIYVSEGNSTVQRFMQEVDISDFNNYEFSELVNFAKYLISKRGAKND